MYEFDFKDTDRTIHFIGIGGISMSTLAELLMEKGFTVSGSDMHASQITEHLMAKGANIAIGQRAENITDDIDAVIITAAIHEDNPELAAARKKGLPVMTRAQLLGLVMKLYKMPCAIAGAHGKTTVTSMVSQLLLSAGADPTLSIGGILPSINGNFRIGRSDHFVTEACEYTNSFLSFFPKYEIILNIDADHLDFFKDLDDIRSSFARFACLIPEDGALIINGGIDNLSQITEGVKGRIITFGESSENDYSAADITFDELARGSFTLLRSGEKCGSFTLGVPGRHNVYNALSVIALADIYGIDHDTVRQALTQFTGTKRRFELKGTAFGCTIIDDYAHHPEEIKATLKTAAAYPHKKLWVVFQPHTYTRTKALMEEFADALSLCENVILAPIYPARETDDLGISSETLAELMNSMGHTALCPGDFDDIKKFLEKNLSPGDLLITMGAGNVVDIGEMLLS